MVKIVIIIIVIWVAKTTKRISTEPGKKQLHDSLIASVVYIVYTCMAQPMF